MRWPYDKRADPVHAWGAIAAGIAIASALYTARALDPHIAKSWWWPTNWMVIPVVVVGVGLILFALPVRRFRGQAAPRRAAGGRARGLRSARQITDRALLGIHPSIPLPAGADPSLSPDLPLYVRRDVDADLHAWITGHQESGGFLLLVGPAASGKTRCASELVQGMVGDWPMFMPATAAELTEYFEADPPPGELIIWLDKTQKFLGTNGLTAATLRRILARPRPAIIVGTIEIEDYDTLTELSIALSETQRNTREILTMIAYRKDLLPDFSPGELKRAQRLAHRDPRIDEAVCQADSANVPEILAAAPDLISRWVNPSNPDGAAVITAAVIARRCGHPEPLPPAVLKPLAKSVLTPVQRGRATRKWFRIALDWAREPVRGAAAPLTPLATTPGAIDGYQVSDVLVQHAARYQHVPGHTISEPILLLLIDKASPQACQAIAEMAFVTTRFGQWRFSVAKRAFRKAASAGDTDAMFNLGIFLAWHQREKGEAEQWLRKAASAGRADAMCEVGDLLKERGKESEAEQWFHKSASAGYEPAFLKLAGLLVDQGKESEAEQWIRLAEQQFRKHADEGDGSATVGLLFVLTLQGKEDEAEQWRPRAEQFFREIMKSLNLIEEVDTAIPSAMSAIMLILIGNEDEAERLRESADAGEAESMAALGILRMIQGKEDEAKHWLRKAVAAGSTLAAMPEVESSLAEKQISSVSPTEPPASSTYFALAHVSNGDGNRAPLAHYVDQDQLAINRTAGQPVTALCGYVWAPSRDPHGYPVCPACREIYDQLPSG